MTISKITNLIIALIVLIVIVVAIWFWQTSTIFQIKINTSSAAVVKEMRNLQRLETASFTIEKIIDGGTIDNNVFSKLLFGEKILLIAHGQVIAGFDLSQISENDIKINANNLVVILPKAQILITTLDNTQTRVYDRQRGLLNAGDKDLESKVREAAEKSIRAAACTSGILKQAEDNARKQLTALFSALGFTSVTLQIPESSCQ
jgi:hypothetical protein